MLEFNVKCLPGGAWDDPEEWPQCLQCESQAPKKNVSFLKNPKPFSGELFGTPGKARRRDLAVEREFWIQDKDQLHMRTIWKLPQVKDKDKYKDKDKD